MGLEEGSIIVVLILLGLVASVGCSTGTNVMPKEPAPEVTTTIDESKPNLVVDENIKIWYTGDAIVDVIGTITNKSMFAVGKLKLKHPWTNGYGERINQGRKGGGRKLDFCLRFC
jgi:hypothetical protein